MTLTAKRLHILLIALLLLVLASPAAQARDSESYQMLINKQHTLAADYIPDDLVRLNDYMRANSSVTLTRTAAEALGRMVADMKAAGISDIYGSSGYRSFDLQTTLYERKTKYYISLGYEQEAARAAAATVVAPPGASEHQSGMAIDLSTGANGNNLTESFAATPAGMWLAENCWRYGFILRYGQNKADITGYIFEPWHFRYVGAPHAEYMTLNDLCLEEYLALLQQEMITYTAADGLLYAVYFRAEGQGNYRYQLSSSQAFPQGEARIITTQPQNGQLYDLIQYWGAERIRQMMLLSVLGGYAPYDHAVIAPQTHRELDRDDLTALMEPQHNDAAAPPEQQPPPLSVAVQYYQQLCAWSA